MSRFGSAIEALRKEIQWRLLLGAIATAGPPVAAYAIAGDPLLLKVALIAICLYVAAARIRLGPLAIALHWLLILALIVMLWPLRTQEFAFAIANALLVAGVIALTFVGQKLKSLGIYSFLPSLYVVCELSEEAATQAEFQRFCLLMGLALPLAIAARAAVAWPGWAKIKQSWRWQAWEPLERGAPATQVAPFLAAPLAVLAATLIAVTWQVPHSEWLIWSAVSVVTADVVSAAKKLKDRGIGALVGVPLGLLLAWPLPQAPGALSLIVVLAVSSLVAFKTYVYGFAARCALIAMAALLAYRSPLIAAERVENVILGGVIGFALLYLFERFLFPPSERATKT